MPEESFYFKTITALNIEECEERVLKLKVKRSREDPARLFTVWVIILDRIYTSITWPAAVYVIKYYTTQFRSCNLYIPIVFFFKTYNNCSIIQIVFYDLSMTWRRVCKNHNQPRVEKFSHKCLVVRSERSIMRLYITVNRFKRLLLRFS